MVQIRSSDRDAAVGGRESGPATVRESTAGPDISADRGPAADARLLRRSVDRDLDILGALVERLNAAHHELKVVEAELAASEADLRRSEVDEQEVRQMLASLRDVAQEVFTEAEPAELAEFYRSIGLAVSYDHQSRVAEASVTLAPSGRAAVGGVTGVRGGL